MSETGARDLPDDALLDLLVKQATEGLSPTEQRVLEALDSGVVSRELEHFERAAAAVSLAGIGVGEKLPAALSARLERAGQTFVTTSRTPSNVVPLVAPPARADERGGRRGEKLGWFAAAACLVLAVVGWLRQPESLDTPVADVQVPAPLPVEPPPVAPSRATSAPPSPVEARAALLANPAALKVTLAATKDPAAAGIKGDVVWDPKTSQGFIHFIGLVANDPHIRQYQMWIFDGQRDPRYPVDGGVFDVPANAEEVVIPIHAELPVGSVKAFAVTVEKPGGVVVSARAHVLALGAAG